MRRFLRWLDKFEVLSSIPESWSKEEITVYNLICVARIITENALARKQSLGAHFVVEEQKSEPIIS
jgi:aspartate oxidase